MSPRGAIVLVTLVCAARPAVAFLPAECEAVVNSSADAGRVSSVTVRRCSEALRAWNAPDAGAAERAEPARPARQFAVISELEESGVRFGRTGASQASAPKVAYAAAGSTPGTCALDAPGSASVASERCLECHPRQGHSVGGAYAASYGRASWNLRPEDEVVRRGVLLPQGRLECVTCHDGASPWKYKIALPPGAPALPAVVTGKPETYEGRKSWRLVKASEAPPLPHGAQVSSAPLCAACHTHAD